MSAVVIMMSTTPLLSNTQIVPMKNRIPQHSHPAEQRECIN